MIKCSGCGATADAPLGWMVDLDEHGATYLCDQCCRDHLRAVEGRLDPARAEPAWW